MLLEVPTYITIRTGSSSEKIYRTDHLSGTARGSRRSFVLFASGQRSGKGNDFCQQQRLQRRQCQFTVLGKASRKLIGTCYKEETQCSNVVLYVEFLSLLRVQREKGQAVVRRPLVRPFIRGKRRRGITIRGSRVRREMLRRAALTPRRDGVASWLHGKIRKERDASQKA